MCRIFLKSTDFIYTQLETFQCTRVSIGRKTIPRANNSFCCIYYCEINCTLILDMHTSQIWSFVNVSAAPITPVSVSWLLSPARRAISWLSVQCPGALTSCYVGTSYQLVAPPGVPTGHRLSHYVHPATCVNPLQGRDVNWLHFAIQV